MKTICLNMIVKNERPVIQRCLASVKPIIDYWVILDTGSTDGTQPFIRDFMQDIHGELHEAPWINFEHNRNIALEFAKNKADYILFIDADEMLVFHSEFDKTKLDKDFYFAMKKSLQTQSRYTLLIRNDPRWHWKDVLHEYITSTCKMYGNLIQELSIDCTFNDGHRTNDSEKSLKDAQILLEALQKDPNNTRYAFYLALSYANAKKHDQALKYYQKRALLGGEAEEVFWSLYSMARLQQHLAFDHVAIVDGYCKAYLFDPKRAEPLYCLAYYLAAIGAPILGYFIAKLGLELKQPVASSRVQPWIYEYGMFLIYKNLSQ